MTRSDYFLDRDVSTGEVNAKQVEINLSSVVGLHVTQELMTIHEDVLHLARDERRKFRTPRDSFSESIGHMNEEFRRTFGVGCHGESTHVLYISGSEETNFVEMMFTVQQLRKNGVSVIHM